jgi:uncharacterized membrane protein
VDMSKVKIDVMSKWITERVVSILGFEDDIVINLAINMLNEQVSISLLLALLIDASMSLVHAGV